jgi:predicted amidohydrolase YtcJ
MESYNLINANIITLDSSLKGANSLTVSNGKIESINQINRSYKTLDLNGYTVIPGFIDAHFHLKNFGKRLEMLNLKGLQSLEQIEQAIKLKLRDLNSNEWLIGFGWDQNLWVSKEYPPSHFLNKISPDNPVYLTRIDGHSAWVNDCAINLTQHSIDEIKNQEGADVVNECIMIDNAMNCFKQYLPKETKDQVKKWIKTAVNKTMQMGITGVHDAWQDSTIVLAVQELIEEGNFPIRCYGMLGGNDKNLLNQFFNQGHYESDYLKIRSVKAFVDGALGSRGAALHEPYCDDRHNCGLILISQDDFQELSRECYHYNFQLNTHAIGDRGNSYVLDHYSKFLKPDNNRRWRIEHAQMVADCDLSRFKDFSILPSMQPSHCTSDMPWLNDRIGPERLSLISRWQTFIDLGLKIPGGSDCPIETGNPLFEFYAAVTRQDHQGLPAGGWQSQEKVNHLNALKMFTSWAAYGGFDEETRGQIKTGYDADLTILSNDLLDIQADQILETKILATIVNGKIIYNQL